MTARQPIALTMGDPAGVGPEITLLAWQTYLSGDAPRFVVIGDPDIYRSIGFEIAEVGSLRDADSTGTALPVHPIKLPQRPTKGEPNGANASAVIQSIEIAVRAVLMGDAAALVTNPISKATLYDAGFRHQGHTDFLGALTADTSYEGPRGPVMMLMAADLKVALVTEHLSLRAAAETITRGAIVHTARVVARSLQQDFGIASPRLSVAALNPHAGERGALGDEEARIIAPAIAELGALGLSVRGPLPADTLFHAEARRQSDAVICMYHDQGLIPVKMLDFWGGVNVTLGLPIVRTSPDHGTGFDIAGKGVARPDSLITALKAADAIARRRART
ncbi:MAG: 4-hydroxythreonine-4-phosphate dehydrogenase PdxA [Caulobacterales bacterium]